MDRSFASGVVTLSLIVNTLLSFFICFIAVTGNEINLLGILILGALAGLNVTALMARWVWGESC